MSPQAHAVAVQPRPQRSRRPQERQQRVLRRGHAEALVDDAADGPVDREVEFRHGGAARVLEEPRARPGKRRVRIRKQLGDAG